MIRLGIVDFDSSHSIEFTRRFNHAGVDAEQWVDGARVVLGCPGTSTMAPERIAGFTQQITDCGVDLVRTPEEMIGSIDAVLVLSLCGSVHRERVRPFLDAGIPAYVDKPFACSWNDAREMVRLADENAVPLFSSSALRFSEEIQSFQRRRLPATAVSVTQPEPNGIDSASTPESASSSTSTAGPESPSDPPRGISGPHELFGGVYAVVSYGPAKRADGNPGLFHYGIHATEMLFTIMGDGCRSVSSTLTEGADVVTACWADGRVATLRGNRQGCTAYGILAFCEHGIVSQPVSSRFAYRNLCRAIVETFRTGRPTVANHVTLEIVKFVLACLQSERRNGEFVSLDSIT